METLLVARDRAGRAAAAGRLYAAKEVELRADPEALAILQGYPHLVAALKKTGAPNTWRRSWR
jgi:glutamate-5-semialdehyde dehydrogenase